MSDWQKLQEFIEGHDEAVLLVHEKPDGDCLGSALALGLYLKSRGITPVMPLPDPIPKVYSFLPGQDLVKVKPSGQLEKKAVVIAVDCTDLNRIEYTIPPENPVINIDHHVSNLYFGSLNIVDTGAAAAGEIIYRLFKEGQVDITPDIATLLYVAISTDTGSFIYSNTTPETMQAASELLALKTDLDLVRRHLHEKRPYEELVTVKTALTSLFLENEGMVIGCTLSYSDLQENNLLTADTDGLIGMMRATDGVEVALLFKELRPGEIKVSLRSKNYVDVNLLAGEFGGGGHPRAAGCTVRGNLEKVVEEIVTLAGEYLKRRDS